MMKTLIFAVAGYNLAETGRMLEIAQACKDKFKIIFISYGGQYEHYIEEAGFKLKKMEPRLTEGQLHHVRKALSGETLNTVGYFTAKEMEPRIENELKLFKEIKPACVLTGWCQSVLISARAGQVPFVNVLHSTSITEYYQAGLQSWPDRSNFPFLRWFFSEEKLNRWVSNLVLKMKLPAKPFNTLAEKYGLTKFNNFIEVIEGDYTLLADIPEWIGFSEIQIIEMPKDKPIVYFAMGSSGKPKIIAEIIQGFKDKPYQVIAPVKAHIENLDIQIPTNVVVTGFIPAHKVNPKYSNASMPFRNMYCRYRHAS